MRKLQRICENAGHFFDADVARDVEQNAYVSHAMRDGWQVWKRMFYKCRESIKLHTKSVRK